MAEIHPINQLYAAGAPDFVTHDAETLLSQAIAHFEAGTGRSLSPMQVETYLLETIAYMLTLRGIEEQAALEKSFVAYAPDDFLDVFGAERNTPRLAAEKATTTLRFTVTAGALSAIPAGTRVSDGTATFATDARAAVASSATTVDVPASAEATGVTYNGIAAGALTQMVDTIAGIVAVTNLTATVGGSAREPMARYRARIAQAFERISRGGSKEGYETLVYDWSTAIVDVEAIRPQPGYITIYPLLADGEMSAAERTAVRDWLYRDNLVPMGDFVSVVPPVLHAFAVPLHLVLSDPAAAASATAAAQAVLDDWRLTLGGYIAPSELIAAAKAVTGIIDASIDDDLLAFSEVAATACRAGTLTVTIEVAG